MKKIIFSLIVVTMILAMSGCGSSKGVAYVTNIDSISLEASRGLYDAKIMPKDELTIRVNTLDPAASAPFNQQAVTSNGGGQNTASTGGGAAYLVDNDGTINFPLVGKLHVVGLTKGECEDLIKSKIQPYLARTEVPIVTVRMSSYRVVVIGEVSNPKVIPVATEQMNIIEALAQAGDLTIFGKRNNILLIRTDRYGQKHSQRINIQDANLLNSPYYYLQQNDIIYVQPNNVKARNSSIGASTTLWMSFVGIVSSIASLIVNVVK